MIENVQNGTQAQPAQQGQAQPTTAAPEARGKSFAAMLAHESTRNRRSDGPARDAGPSSEVRDRIAKAPEGETWKPVPGRRDYAEITSGPRAGQYINLTRGSRRGLTFTIEKQDGKTFHVYGAGDDAQRVEVARGRRLAGEARPAPGETWERIEGHNNYADILGGRRNGWYVNISGGDRHGQVFHVVQRGGKTFHVYGRGDDKLWVEVRTRTAPADEPASGDATPSSSDATGGASAPN